MKDKIETNIRKWISLIVAVLIYYVIHEGSHLLVALSYGVFKKKTIYFRSTNCN